MAKDKVVLTPTKTWKEKVRPLLVSILLCLVVAIAHGSSIWNGFILKDRFLLEPFGAVGVSKAKWAPVWFELYTDAFLKPFSEGMTRLSLAFDYQSAHLATPAVYHVSNILLHTLAVLAAFYLLLRLRQKADISLGVPLLTLLIFACHPLTCDSVAYIAGRGSMLTFIWYMLSLHAFLSGFQSKSVRGAVFGNLICYLSLVVSIFSSCQAITLPWAMLALTAMVKPEKEKWKDYYFARAYELSGVVFVGVALPFLFLMRSPVPDAFILGRPLIAASLFIASQARAFCLYFLKGFILPFGYSIDPPTAVSSLFDPFIYFGLALMALLIATAVKLRRPFFSLGVFFTLFALIPKSFVVSCIVTSGDHYYLSTFGLSLCVASLLCERFKLPTVRFDLKNKDWQRALAAISLPLALLSGLCLWREHNMSSNRSLIAASLRVTAEKEYLKALLAWLLSVEGGSQNIDQGHKDALSVLTRRQDLALAQMTMGNWAQANRDREGAKYYFTKARELAISQKLPEMIVAFAEGGIACAMSGLDQIKTEAERKLVRQYAEHALKFDPTVARYYLPLGRVILAEGRPESAELACRKFDEGRRYDLNDTEFLLPLAQAALKTGYPDRLEKNAYGAAQLLYRLDPTNCDKILLFARAALETGRIRKGFAIMTQYFEQSKKPSAEAFLVLSKLEKQFGRPAYEEFFLKEALALDKDIEKKVKFFLVVKPKKDDQGPSGVPNLPRSSHSQAGK